MAADAEVPEHELARAVECALDAIRADSPAYAEALRPLLPASAQLAQRAREPLISELLAELRKLRPIGLWVRDRASIALEAKRELALDGALCVLSVGELAPPAQGRECWLELDLPLDDGALAALPGGYGLVLRGPAHDLSVAAIRRRAPLRALGVACATIDELPQGRLDLVLLERGVPAEVGGARVLCSGLEPESVRMARSAPRLDGLVCDASHACAWALRLAAHRPPRGR